MQEVKHAVQQPEWEPRHCLLRRRNLQSEKCPVIPVLEVKKIKNQHVQ